MELIERYIYAVTRRLPESQRNDVAKELRGNIEDMLSDHPTQEEIETILRGLGEPSKLANEYRGNKRYLIGPDYFDKYVSILKLVAVILAIIGGAGAFIESYAQDFANSSNDVLFFLKTVGLAIGQAIEGGIHALFWVTGIFFLLEKFDVLYEGKKTIEDTWVPNDLPEIPLDYEYKIRKSEMVWDMIGNFFWFYLIWKTPKLIYFSSHNNDYHTIVSLFNFEHIQSYAGIFFLYVMVCVGVNVYKWIVGHWNYPVAIIDSIYRMIGFVLFAVMVTDKGNYATDHFYSLSNPDLNKVLVDTYSHLDQILNTIVLIGVFVLCITVGQSFYKAYKNHSK